MRAGGLVVEPVAVPVIPARGRATVTIEATPLRRGTVRFETVHLANADRVGGPFCRRGELAAMLAGL